jgi:FlaG/FlaF family flagellin (archaellin)
MKGFFTEEAEGEVLGTILMVAICVILAAIVAVMAFGMMEEPEESRPIGVTAVRTPACIKFTYVGGPYYDSVKEVRCFINNTGDYVLLEPVVGQVNTTTLANDDPSGTTDILIIAEYKDGTKQLMMDTKV